MAAVTKSGLPAISTAAPPFNCRISELEAGETLGACDPCYIKASDGKVYKAVASAADEKRIVAGWAVKDAVAGQPITLVWDVRFGDYGTLTVNALYFLSATVAGGLDTVTSANAGRPIAWSPDGQRLEVFRNLQLIGVS